MTDRADWDEYKLHYPEGSTLYDDQGNPVDTDDPNDLANYDAPDCPSCGAPLASDGGDLGQCEDCQGVFDMETLEEKHWDGEDWSSGGGCDDGGEHEPVCARCGEELEGCCC